VIFIVEFDWSISGEKYLGIYEEFRARNLRVARKKAQMIIKKENKDPLNKDKRHTFKFTNLFKKVLVT